MAVLASIFDMGVRASFIWSALGVTAGVMLLMVLLTLRSARIRAREWQEIAKASGRAGKDADEAEV